MKGTVWVILVAALATGSSCTHPDWIERTLVTVDVTGTWEGSSAQASSAAFWLSFEQQGAQVKGSIRISGNSNCFGAINVVGPIEGTVAGDVLNFKQTNTAFVSRMTVSGDEMSGGASNRCGPFTLTLRRVDAASGTTSPKQ